MYSIPHVWIPLWFYSVCWILSSHTTLRKVVIFTPELHTVWGHDWYLQYAAALGIVLSILSLKWVKAATKRIKLFKQIWWYMPLRPAQRWLSEENNKLQTNQDYIAKPYQEGGGGKGEENKEREKVKER